MFKSAHESTGRSLREPVRVTGRGLHSGQATAVELRPREGPGIRFVVDGEPIAVGVEAARAPGGMTRLVDGTAAVDTPEHLLAAVLGLGITHLDIALEGSELPALDGSALPWAAMLTDTVSAGPVTTRVVHEPMEIEAFWCCF